MNGEKLENQEKTKVESELKQEKQKIIPKSQRTSLAKKIETLLPKIRNLKLKEAQEEEREGKNNLNFWQTSNRSRDFLGVLRRFILNPKDRKTALETASESHSRLVEMVHLLYGVKSISRKVRNLFFLLILDFIFNTKFFIFLLYYDGLSYFEFFIWRYILI